MPALPVDAVDPLDGRTRREGRGAGVGPWSRELVARAGDDHHTVIVVGADVIERLGQLSVRQEPPAQRAAIGVQRHLQNAVSPLHPDRLVLVGVVLELAHGALRNG